jgi:hypothetical protein
LPSGKTMTPSSCPPPQKKKHCSPVKMWLLNYFIIRNVSIKLCNTYQMLGSKWGFIYNWIIIGFHGWCIDHHR